METSKRKKQAQEIGWIGHRTRNYGTLRLTRTYLYIDLIPEGLERAHKLGSEVPFIKKKNDGLSREL